MKLYILRHGTTDNNVNNLINGRNDIDINSLGIEEAKRAKLILQDIKFDQIFCSPLLRAKHTLEIVNIHKYPVIYDERLLERDAGVMTNRNVNELDLDLWYKINIGTIYRDSESFDDVIKRGNDFLNEIKKKYKDNTILLVTHAGVMKAIEVILFGYPGIEEVKKWDYPNGAVKEYKI